VSRAGVAKVVAVVTLSAALAACAPDNRGGNRDGGQGDDDDAADANLGADDGGNGFIDAVPLHIPDGGAEINCNALPAKVRDFHASPPTNHPDFEHFTTDAISPGIVATTLGADGTPTWVSPGTPACTTGAAEFADWYHDRPGVNMAIPVTLTLTQQGNGVSLYDNGNFFPADSLGFGNEGAAHNFGFTTEIHTKFKYLGGETFTFRGDDDLWLFINKKLAIDLGGLHQPQQQVLNLDAQASTLGLVVGNTYDMDIFHAERHSTASNFRIETTIDCLIVPQ
jgi:fibro-slime domain-containing protein